MKVERLKYVIWAADMNRAVNFYSQVFGGTILKQNDIISEVAICDGIIGIHGGGEGNRTWTGLSFQVPDVIAGAAEIVAAGGQLVREPQPEDDEPPHLAMCVDTEGNEIMLTRKRAHILINNSAPLPETTLSGKGASGVELHGEFPVSQSPPVG